MLLRLTTLVAPFLGAMLFAAPMLFAGSDGALAQAPAGSPPVRARPPAGGAATGPSSPANPTGRVATRHAWQHFGLPMPAAQELQRGMFEGEE